MQDNKKTTSLESYEAPKCEIIEIQNEGVLCGLKYRMKACCAAAITVPHTVVLKTATK